mmetsp:Transcript_123206/g.192446  ORF Transcript_123206/g.192446 Transcript_123206/m.192446 type:complete len:91 (+) Transcript_123206:63-335(+)
MRWAPWRLSWLFMILITEPLLSKANQGHVHSLQENWDHTKDTVENLNRLFPGKRVAVATGMREEHHEALSKATESKVVEEKKREGREAEL